MNTIHQIHPVHFEKWDYRNLDTGIGGSETCQIETSWRLARRGYDVVNYAPIRDDTSPSWRGSIWLPLDDADYSQPGVWVIYRAPELLDNFEPRDDQELWLLCQDVHYGDSMTEDRLSKVDKIIGLCRTHCQYLRDALPFAENKVVQSSNGVRTDLMREVAFPDLPYRNPKKWIWSSSPDRGLEATLKIFSRCREYDPEIELHICYGFDNLAKMRGQSSLIERLRQQIKSTEGVHNHGRVGQKELYWHYLTSGLWVYASQFSETNCIASQEAQCMGAIPLTNPIWAVGEKLQYGCYVEGNVYNDSLVRSKYVATALRLVSDPEWQENLRRDKMRICQSTFSWERTIDQWDAWISDFPALPAQWNFQRKHWQGRVCNVGCDIDAAGFREMGAVNVDCTKISPVTHAPTAVDVVADVRQGLPFEREFDTVLLGDILEHMSDEDATRAVENSAAVLRDGGRVIITVPDDTRHPWEQHGGITQPGAEYCDGVSAYHERPVSRDNVEQWVSRAGLRTIRYQELDYGWADGHGVVAEIAG